MWKHIWDVHCPHSDYNMFFDIFKFLMLKQLGLKLVQRISQGVKEMIRPIEHEQDTKHQFSWGDWYLHTNYTTIRTYGTPVPPHKFPIYVLDRQDFMEVMWRMDGMDKEYFRGPKKASLVNPDVQFAYFSSTSKEGIERFGSFL